MPEQFVEEKVELAGENQESPGKDSKRGRNRRQDLKKFLGLFENAPQTSQKVQKNHINRGC